jgi:hypothetical protein
MINGWLSRAYARRASRVATGGVVISATRFVFLELGRSVTNAEARPAANIMTQH